MEEFKRRDNVVISINQLADFSKATEAAIKRMISQQKEPNKIFSCLVSAT